MGKYIGHMSKMDEKRIFCFPYAGGTSNVFFDWKSKLKKVGVYPINYPGRGKRINEEPISNMNMLIREICEDIISDIRDCPFYFFGHSLGTKIQYELTLMLQNEYGIFPEALIVSGGNAPNIREKNPIHRLDDEHFINSIIDRYNSIPKEFINDEELKKLFLPSLRSDFILDETYTCKQDKVKSKIYGIMGKHDSEVTIEDFISWENFTELDFKYTVIEGGHMFINSRKDDVIRFIQEVIDESYA